MHTSFCQNIIPGLWAFLYRTCVLCFGLVGDKGDLLFFCFVGEIDWRKAEADLVFCVYLLWCVVLECRSPVRLHNLVVFLKKNALLSIALLTRNHCWENSQRKLFRKVFFIKAEKIHVIQLNTFVQSHTKHTDGIQALDGPMRRISSR